MNKLVEFVIVYISESIESNLAIMTKRSESDNCDLARFQSQEIHSSHIYLIVHLTLATTTEIFFSNLATIISRSESSFRI